MEIIDAHSVTHFVHYFTENCRCSGAYSHTQSAYYSSQCVTHFNYWLRNYGIFTHWCHCELSTFYADKCYSLIVNHYQRTQKDKIAFDRIHLTLQCVHDRKGCFDSFHKVWHSAKWNKKPFAIEIDKEKRQSVSFSIDSNPLPTLQLCGLASNGIQKRPKCSAEQTMAKRENVCQKDYLWQKKVNVFVYILPALLHCVRLVSSVRIEKCCDFVMHQISVCLIQIECNALNEKIQLWKYVVFLWIAIVF